MTFPDARRWFLPLTGDLRAGGTYQLEGNASGDIVACDPPAHLVLTFGGASSVVDLRLAADGGQTLYGGPGWGGAVMALSQYLDGQLTEDPVAAAGSPESQAFSAESIEAWTAIIQASGTTDADAVDTARKAALGQFAQDLGHH